MSAAKAAQKVEFDRRHRVTVPDWSVGEKVWLEQGLPRAKSPSVLIHKRYGAVPFYITKIVQRPPPLSTQGNQCASVGDAPIATAYQLVNSKTGKALRYLVPSKRLKKCYETTRLDQLCPSAPNRDLPADSTGTAENSIQSSAQVPETSKQLPSTMQQRE
jgi:hypothetical protein